MPKLKNSTAANALVGIWTVLLTAFIVATLYFARDFPTGQRTKCPLDM
jgi:hypothetical protein